MSQSTWQMPFPAAPVPEQAPATFKTPPRSANLWQLTYNELYKLWKRRLVWGLLALDLFFVFGAWCVLVFYSLKTKDGFTPGHLLGGSTALTNAIIQPMTLGRRGGEFISVALGGLAFGGEFSSGAIRLVLSRGVSRASYLVAKYLALAIACVALVVASLLMSMLLSNALIVLNPHAPTLLRLNGPTLVAVLSSCLGMLENFLFCLLFGAALSIITRSAAFGIAAGFGYLIAEDIGAQILPVIGNSLHTLLGHWINELLFTTNLNAFYANSLPHILARGLDTLDGVIACSPSSATVCTTVNAGQALLVAAIWGLVFAVVSTVMFIKRDVLQ